MFENDFAVCWKTTISPGNPLKMHRHERCRVVDAQEGGILLKTEETGETSELNFETGKAVSSGQCFLPCCSYALASSVRYLTAPLRCSH